MFSVKAPVPDPSGEKKVLEPVPDPDLTYIGVVGPGLWNRGSQLGVAQSTFTKYHFWFPRDEIRKFRKCHKISPNCIGPTTKNVQLEEK